MCTNYTPTGRERLRAMALGVSHLPVSDWPDEVFPGYAAPIIMGGDAPRVALARFGLVPRWCADAGRAADIARRTYNARSETVDEKPSYRAPWRQAQWALAPMERFFEPCWEGVSGVGSRAVRWGIGRADGEPFTAAALWERWTDRTTGEVVTSFTLLTVNADGHPLMGRMHRPGDEKRSLVPIAPQDRAVWLGATPDQARVLLQRPAPHEWVGAPMPRRLPGATPRAQPVPTFTRELFE